MQKVNFFKKKKVMPFLLSISFALVFGQNTHGQCRFIQIKAVGDTLIKQIPCDFPVINISTATQQERDSFTVTVKKWKESNPGFDGLVFVQSSTLEFFEINQSDFENFSEERKLVIQALPAFYKIINK
jgi:hypothetical protein